MNKEQRKHYDRIARLGCILCYHLELGETPPHLHHIRRAGRRDTAPVIPLCFNHHVGNLGIHGLGRKAFEKKYNITEEELLEKALELLNDRPQQKQE